MAGNTGYQELTAGQANKEVTVNSNFALFDGLLTGQLSVTISTTSPVTISSQDYYDFCIYTLDDDVSTPPTANFTVQVPATTRGIFVVQNNTSYTATIEISGQAITPPTLAAGEVSQLDSDGVNVLKP